MADDSLLGCRQCGTCAAAILATKMEIVNAGCVRAESAYMALAAQRPHGAA